MIKWLKMKSTKSAILAVMTQGIKLIPASPDVKQFLVMLGDLLMCGVIVYLASNVGE